MNQLEHVTLPNRAAEYRLRFPRRRAFVSSNMDVRYRPGSRRLARRRSSGPSRCDGMEFSPAATDAAESRAQARPSTVPHAPMSDLHRKRASNALWKSPRQEVGRAGLYWTVEVEHVLETLQHRAAEGAILSPHRPIENATANIAGPANGPRGGSPLAHSSQGTFAGMGTVTDTITLPNLPSPIDGRDREMLAKNSGSEEEPASCLRVLVVQYSGIRRPLIVSDMDGSRFCR